MRKEHISALDGSKTQHSFCHISRDLRPSIKPPRRPVRPNRLERKTSLTIAASFFFSQGIVLCADSQFSNTQTKTAGSKIINHRLVFASGNSTSIVFAFSGTVDYSRAAIEGMCEALRTTQEKDFTLEGVQQTLGDSLHDFYTKHIYSHPSYGAYGCPTVELLIAFCPASVKQCALFRTNETILVTLPSYGCVGSGVLLASYLIPILYRHPNMALKDVVAVAVNILYQTKRYVEGCGGKSEFLILYNNGTTGLADYLDVNLAEHFSDFYDIVLRNIFLEACDGEASDAVLRSAVESLYTLLQAHRDTVRERKGFREAFVKALSAPIGNVSEVVP